MNAVGEQTVALRRVHESDLDALFHLMRDPESVRMAAFTSEGPNDRQRFDAHMVRAMESPETTLRDHLEGRRGRQHRQLRRRGADRSGIKKQRAPHRT